MNPTEIKKYMRALLKWLSCPNDDAAHAGRRAARLASQGDEFGARAWRQVEKRITDLRAHPNDVTSVSRTTAPMARSGTINQIQILENRNVR